MSEDAARQSPTSRLATTPAERGSLAVAGLLSFASLYLLVHPWYVPLADAAMYIETARSLAAGEGYRFLGEPFVVRPPGFSLLLAPVLAVRGADFFAIHLLVSLTGLAAVVFFYLLARERVGWPLALALSAMVWFNPGYQALCNSVMSDIPGTAAVLGCFVLERWLSRRAGSWRAEAGLGLCLGLASLVRASNAIAIPAILLGRLFAGGRPVGERWRSFAFAVVALLVLAPWVLYQQANRPEPPADQTRLLDYGTAMFHEDPGDPSSRRLGWLEIAARIPSRAQQNLAVIGTGLGVAVKGSEDDPFAREAHTAENRIPPRTTHVALGAVMLGCLLFEWVRRRAALEWFGLGTMASLLVYFGFQHRLALPVYLVALLATAAAAQMLALRWLGPRATAPWLVAIVAVLTLRAGDWRYEWDVIETLHGKHAAASTAVASMLGPDDRAATWRGFHHGVFLGRPVYSLHRSVARLGTAQGLSAVIDRYEIDTIFLTTTGLLPLRAELRARYGEPRREGNAVLWRVGGSAESADPERAKP